MRKITKRVIVIGLMLLVFSIMTVTSYASDIFTVTVLNDGNGTAYSYVVSCPPGTAVTLVATPNSGYQLKEWQVVSGGVEVNKSQSNDTLSEFIMLNEDVVLKAIFEPLPQNNANTIFSTGYESNFWNWFRFIVLFGWIWMWF